VSILYRRREATVKGVLDSMRDPPGYSAVRALLRLLEEKGHVKHRQVGRRYVYRPTVGLGQARRSALRHLVRTFFGGSVEQCVTSMLDMDAGKLTDAQLDRLSEIIEEARSGMTR
jgi:predicted transcriptional regulator